MCGTQFWLHQTLLLIVRVKGSCSLRWFIAVGVRSIAMSVCVCLSTPISQKRHVQASRNFLPMITVAVVLSSSEDNVIRYVLPVLRMTSCLPMIMSHVGVANRTHTLSDWLGGSTGTIPPLRRMLNVIHQGVARGRTQNVYNCMH